MDYLKLSGGISHKYNYYLLNACRRSISSSRLKECHDLLKVDKTSTPKQIKESFLRLSKVYHPDNKHTGSHTKFVKLKQAYDEIKDAPKASISDNQYYNPEDLTHKAYTQYREKERSYYYDSNYTRRYDNEFNKSHGFGGPYAQSENPWEQLRRDRMFRRHQNRQQDYYNRYMRRRTIAKTITWIFLLSSFLIVKDISDNISKDISDDRIRSRKEYTMYREYVRAKEKEKSHEER